MLMQSIKCFLKGSHNPKRVLIGGFVCKCGKSGADLSDMGFGIDAGYVNPVRKIFTRNPHTVTRTSSWDKES